MNLYVAKNQQKHGPYTVAEVQSRIATGEFVESDLGWHDGVQGWQPLSQLLGPLPATPQVGPSIPSIPPAPLKSSGLAKASFIIALVGIGVWLVLVVTAAVGVSSGMGERSPLMVIVGLGMMAFMAVNLMGAVLGIVALTKPISNKWMALTGLILNGLELVGVLFLMIVGLAQG
jgi:hypothetical protein